MNKEEYLVSIASKYNWFTAEEQKKDISDYILISYVFCYWDIFEIYNIFRLFDYELLLKAYEYIENDGYAFKEKRKETIIYYLGRKKISPTLD